MRNAKHFTVLLVIMITAALLTACGQCNCSCCSGTDAEKTVTSETAASTQEVAKVVTKASAATTANSIAASIKTAGSCVCTDLDTEDYFNTGKLTGSFLFYGSDFENLQKPVYTDPSQKTDLAAMLSDFKYKLHNYYSDVTEIYVLAIEFQSGGINAVAVQTGPFKESEHGSEFYLYGSYPMPAPNNQSSGLTIMNALTNAADGWSSRFSW